MGYIRNMVNMSSVLFLLEEMRRSQEAKCWHFFGFFLGWIFFLLTHFFSVFSGSVEFSQTHFLIFSRVNFFSSREEMQLLSRVIFFSGRSLFRGREIFHGWNMVWRMFFPKFSLAVNFFHGPNFSKMPQLIRDFLFLL